MLIELGKDNSVEVNEIDSIYTEAPPSDADFEYHPVTKVVTKSGTVLESSRTEAELREQIGKMSPTSSALEREVQEPVDISTDIESDTEIREKDDLGELITATKKIGEELEAIRSFTERLVYFVEEGKLNVTVHNTP